MWFSLVETKKICYSPSNPHKTLTKPPQKKETEYKWAEYLNPRHLLARALSMHSLVAYGASSSADLAAAVDGLKVFVFNFVLFVCILFFCMS